MYDEENKEKISSSLTKQLPPAQAVRVCVCVKFKQRVKDTRLGIEEFSGGDFRDFEEPSKRFQEGNNHESRLFFYVL